MQCLLNSPDVPFAHTICMLSAMYARQSMSECDACSLPKATLSSSMTFIPANVGPWFHPALEGFPGAETFKKPPYLLTAC